MTNSSEPTRHNILTVLLIFFLAIELLLVQEYILDTYNLMTGMALAKYLGTRILLSFLLAATLITWLPRTVLTFFCLSQLLFFIIIIEYFNYFSRPLHITTLLYQTGEGVSVLGYAFELIEGSSVLLLIATCGVKLLIISQIKATKLQKKLKTYFLVSYILSLTLLTILVKPISAIQQNWSIDQMMHAYGFVIPWAAETIYLNQENLLKIALEKAKVVDNQLNDKIIFNQNIKKVFVIQVESLDYDILNFKRDGKQVTPYLNSIIPNSLLFKVKAHHYSGSSDADFVMLTGKRPNELIAPYKIYDYPYTDTLIDLAKSKNFKTYSYHGNSGFFYERRNAFISMGVENIIFKEELQKSGLSVYHDWILDDDLLQRVANETSINPQQKALSFVITVTSHGPFSFTPDDYHNNFELDMSKMRDRYIASINYVDNALGRFIKALPKDSLVVIYGDHESATNPNRIPSSEEYVPVLIYVTESNILQNNRQIQHSINENSLVLNDLANMLKNYFIKLEN
ncbi:MAG: sulfatase-like hydrolase/transferase [Gammaproteobacteria bacterium]|nr:sulfatase-like hydrolase/transferase [Gammaproteobacteria bacterium]